MSLSVKVKKSTNAGNLLCTKEQGQIINIKIDLPRKDKIGTVTFTSGWMVYPNGIIKLVTPYARR